jgi:hypothetical protein
LFEGLLSRGGCGEQAYRKGRRSVSRRFAILFAIAFVPMFGAPACGGGVEEQVRDEAEEQFQQGQEQVEEQVQEATQRMEQEAGEARQKVEQEAQEVREKIEEKAGEEQ